MRLFAALPVAPAARAALADATAAFRTAEWPIRWTRTENLHLTLRFYGEVRDAGIAAVADSVRRAADGTPPLDLCTGAVECFPDVRRARVVAVALEAPPALELLQDRLERLALALGFEPEGRPFRPHLTIGRVRHGARLPAGAAARLAGVRAETAFIAEEAVLYESRPGPDGPRYVPQVAVPLHHPTHR